MALLSVVAIAPYAVCLDTGRHLHPGDVTEIEDTPRARGQIADRLLMQIEVVKAPVADPPKTRSSSSSTPDTGGTADAE